MFRQCCLLGRLLWTGQLRSMPGTACRDKDEAVGYYGREEVVELSVDNSCVPTSLSVNPGRPARYSGQTVSKTDSLTTSSTSSSSYSMLSQQLLLITSQQTSTVGTAKDFFFVCSPVRYRLRRQTFNRARPVFYSMFFISP